MLLFMTGFTGHEYLFLFPLPRSLLVYRNEQYTPNCILSSRPLYTNTIARQATAVAPYVVVITMNPIITRRKLLTTKIFTLRSPFLLRTPLLRSPFLLRTPLLRSLLLPDSFAPSNHSLGLPLQPPSTRAWAFLLESPSIRQHPSSAHSAHSKTNLRRRVRIIGRRASRGRTPTNQGENPKLVRLAKNQHRTLLTEKFPSYCSLLMYGIFCFRQTPLTRS